MHYRVKLLLLGDLPTEYDLGKAFIEDERIEASSAFINTDDEISFGGDNPYRLKKGDLELVFEDINFNEIENPGEAEVYFETPVEYEHEIVWDIIDSIIEGLDFHLRAIYLDSDNTPIEKPDDVWLDVELSYN